MSLSKPQIVFFGFKFLLAFCMIDSMFSTLITFPFVTSPCQSKITSEKEGIHLSSLFLKVKANFGIEIY